MRVSPSRRPRFVAAGGRWRSKATLVALLVGCTSVLAGCGGSGSGTSGGATPASSATVITRHLAGYGTVLATPSGQALYELSDDPPGGSKCSGSCTSDWHPLTDNGAPTAGPGINPSLLSTFRRSDGSKQVVYDGHALYTYAGSGQASGAGIASAVGTSYLVSAAGKPIKQTTGGGY